MTSEQVIPISFPFLGVDRGTTASGQPDFTTWDCLNVRALHFGDAQGGGKRDGFAKAFSTQLGVDPGNTVEDAVTGQSAESTWRRINELNLFIATSTGIVVPCEWVTVGTGLDGAGYRLLEHPLDTLNIVGDYTEAGGLAGSPDRFAQYDVSSDVWTDPGADFSAISNPCGLCLFDDGVHGEEMYCAGGTSGAGKLSVFRAGAWVDVDGSGFGGSATLYCCCVHDGDLYVGGIFTTADGVTCNNVAKWDYNGGTPTFVALSSGGTAGTQVAANRAVKTMTSHGGNLYVGGCFATAGATSVCNLAMWNGTTWAALSDGTNIGLGIITAGPVSSLAHEVQALCSWGGLLYIGGRFDKLSSVASGNLGQYSLICTWNATTSSYGQLIFGLRDRGGNSGNITGVKHIEIYDDGTGEKLWVFGSFQAASTSDSLGIAAAGIAFWDGTEWGVPDRGFNTNTANGCILHAIGAGDQSPKKLFVVGLFTYHNAKAAGGLAIYDGSEIIALGGAGACHLNRASPASIAPAPANGSGYSCLAAGTLVNDPVERLYVSIIGTGDSRVYGWGPTPVSRAGVCRLASFALADAKSMWQDVQTTAGSTVTAPSADVYSMQIWMDKLYIGGVFFGSNNPGTRIAAWNGTSWETLGSGCGADVLGMCVHDDGGGEDLYAVCNSNAALFGGVANTGGIGRWNGSVWSALSANVVPVGYATNLCSYNGNLYVAGTFTEFKGATANRVAMWNGTVWATVGQGAGGGFNGGVNAMCVYNDELYAVGEFTSANAVSMLGIAKYNLATNTWEALGTGFDGSLEGHTLCVFGGKLYIGGAFTTVNGITAPHVCAWDGATFTALDGTEQHGIHSTDGALNGDVQAFAVFNEQLAMCGQFDFIGGDTAAFISTTECV